MNQKKSYIRMKLLFQPQLSKPPWFNCVAFIKIISISEIYYNIYGITSHNFNNNQNLVVMVMQDVYEPNYFF